MLFVYTIYNFYYLFIYSNSIEYVLFFDTWSLNHTIYLFIFYFLFFFTVRELTFHNQSTGLTILQYQSLETLDLLIIRWTFFISVIVCVLLFLFVFVCKCTLRRINFFGRGSGTRPVLLGSQGILSFTLHMFLNPRSMWFLQHIQCRVLKLNLS